jgi:hypothetical protein
MSSDKQRLTVLSRLSAEYPSTVSLEEIRIDTSLSESDFRRVIAYLEEKAYVELEHVTKGVEGVFGAARITAAGLDYVEKRCRQVRASIIR